MTSEPRESREEHEQRDPELESLLDYLKRARGFDFTAYKRTSLARRIARRMESVGVPGYGAYLDHLEVHPDEFGHLFNSILVNVTGFFRDELPWARLVEQVIPEILKSKGPRDQVRVWSAGCASGEEVYSLAVLFAQAMGPDAFRSRVKIYGTDASETALARARQAVYSEREVEGVPADVLKRWFTQSGGNYVFDTDLRRSTVFGRHDLISDSPISRVDLLVCRNTLMYFNSETQGRILERFHFALADKGYLMLGKAEMLISNANLFVPVDLKSRIVRKLPRAPGLDRGWQIIAAIPRAPGSAPVAPPTAIQAEGSRMREAALRTAPVAQIIMDADGALAMANEQARHLFGLGDEDIGRRLAELSLYYRPVELRPHIEEAVAAEKTVTVPDVEWPDPQGGRIFELVVTPLTHRDRTPMGVSIAFTDISEYRHLESQLRESNQALQTAQEELQTTNEELQSTVEELETTNEELQSTNEELETMNEELQSTNEELRTSNDELNQRSDQLGEVEAFWRTVVGGLPSGMAVLDGESRVSVWNARAEELWGLRADEVRGRPFLELDIGLPVEQLRTPIAACQVERREARVVLPATNRRGRAVKVRVELTPIVPQPGSLGNGALGCLVLMQEMAE